MQESLIQALDKGGILASKFVSERLVHTEGEAPQKSFYVTLPRSNVKTMSDMNKTVKVRSKTLSVPGEVMYLRLLALNAKKKVPLERVLSFKNSPVPLSMFKDDGSMHGTKEGFIKKLESLLPGDPLTVIDGADAVIIYAMAVIRVLPTTVDELVALKMLQRHGKCIHPVPH